LFDDFNICPYTGLRSFTEEESIYFKGRDEHIQQATAQLEKNKFLMLTGASGDGKSSIVYAGIIPNARAGFLKATYSNWYIADFRPERTPFQNLCKKIAKALKIDNTATVESELQHGFSALVDLYKSSPLYIDTSTAEYQHASEEERKKMQHSSANLMILVDQFEEFFTNPENYVNGVPSNKATLTMNLLLETARIAQEQGIPIYIVFTMRSDFIGQCAAFRELPEYIGFSQFFVPRLNRKLLQEVIEEPCTLSGNRITRRLTERIIHDMTDGVDQLPILQHALNQIWKAADNGKEEMDLIHYAKVGGLDPKELPGDELAKFNSWFDSLAANIQNCFHARSLHNVLDTHANKIYESAGSYLQEKTGKSVADEVVHEIIKTTFTSLTKIDQSREVRNRMTLEEIRDIIDNPAADLETISGIINLFREPGNTFVRPFILEDPSTHNLTEDSILDITHESLIRNWQKLGSWTKEEYDKFVVFKDFKQQVDRWLEHGKSRGFLLPIGSLTFFESWYEDVRINKFWVNRYNEQVTDTPKNIEESSQIVDNSNDFLARSSRKHMVTRAVVKFGPRKVAAVVAAFLLLGLSSFYFYDYRKKTNDYVLNQIKQDAIPLLNGDKAGYDNKASYAINSERINKGQFAIILDGLRSDKNRFKVAIAAAEDLVHHDRKGDLYLKTQAIVYADSMASILYNTIPENQEDQNEGLKDLLNLSEITEFYLYYFEDDEEIKSVHANITTILSKLSLHLLDNPYGDMDMKKFNESIEMGLNHYVFSKTQLEKLASAIAGENTAIQKNYPRDQTVSTERSSNTLSYNGKYQILASIYAALGNTDKCLAAIDILIDDQPRYRTFASSGTAIAGYFARYGHWQALNNYVTGYAVRIGFKPFEVYRQIANKCGYVTQSINDRFQYNLLSEVETWYNPVLDYMAAGTISELYNSYLHSVIATSSPGDERNFNLAIFYKQKGLFTAKYYQDKNKYSNELVDVVNHDYAESFNWYTKTSERYLNEDINVFFHLPSVKPRREVYTYPDYIEHVPSHAPRTRYTNYRTSSFLEYIIDQNLMQVFYPTATELAQVTTWIRDYKTSRYYIIYNYEANILPSNILQEIDSAITNHKNGLEVNNNMLLLITSTTMFNNNQPGLAIDYARRINPLALPDLFNEEFNLAHVKTFELVGELYAKLIVHNQDALAAEIRGVFALLGNRVRLTDRAATEFFINGNDSLGNAYLELADSIIAIGVDIDWVNRKQHAYAASLRGHQGDYNKSGQLIRNAPSFWRSVCYSINVRATAYNGLYFEAYSGIPKFSSSAAKLNTINEILYSQTFYNKEEKWQRIDLYNDYKKTIIGYGN